MKQVFIHPPKVEVSYLRDVVTSKSYGVLLREPGTTSPEKGFISFQTQGGIFYTVFNSKQITTHLYYSDCASSTLEGAVEKSITKGFEVFEFNTTKELFTWLAS